MRQLLPLVLLLASPLAVAITPVDAGNAPVHVEFVNPDSFTDARYDGRQHGGDNPVLAELAGYIEKQAARQLPAGQRLSLHVTDIDLAGHVEPTTSVDLQDVRIVRSIYPPRLDFGWELRDASGAVVREGKESLREVGFNTEGALNSQDPLRYEKRLLRRWLTQTFGR